MADNQDKVPYAVPGTHWIDGIPYPEVVTEDIIRKIKDFPVHEDDVFITGYLKSGNVWTMSTVEAILKSDELDELINQGFTCNPNLFEGSDGYDRYLTDTGRPRIIRTHLRSKYLPKDIIEKKARVVHLMRNPRDVAVSYYHYSKISAVFGYNACSWDTFFDSWINGQVAWGTWYDYVIDWMKYKEDLNIYLIEYEDFVTNPHEVISGLSEFLGRSLHQETVNRIADIVSFTSMKMNPKFDFTYETCKGKFIRKGKVGDWNHFTLKQKKIIEDMYQTFQGETGMKLKFN